MSFSTALAFAGLRLQGAIPRVHGNGFIQVDINDRSRLHVWWPGRVPRQTPVTPIHDHIFGFTSEVLIGRVINIVYEPTINLREGGHIVYRASTRAGDDSILKQERVSADTDPFDTALRVDVGLGWAQTVTAGQSYSMSAGVYHETVSDEPTATVCHKNGSTLGQDPGQRGPRVLVPFGMQPDNAFSRYGHDPELLWTIIRETLAR